MALYFLTINLPNLIIFNCYVTIIHSSCIIFPTFFYNFLRLQPISLFTFLNNIITLFNDPTNCISFRHFAAYSY